MCLIVFAYRAHPAYRLILAANRDEFYARPTTPLAHWDDAPEVLAGRDLVGGGAWLGMTCDGKFAAVTNYRDSRGPGEKALSRGLLVSDFLRGHNTPRTYMEVLQARADCYNGFNLLLGDTNGLYYFCNRENVVRELRPGLYGLSNHRLDTPWPKIQRAKSALRQLLDTGSIQSKDMFEFLADRHKPTDGELPDTGIGIDRERLLSPIFISSQNYGTRSSTVLLISPDGRVSMTERETLSGDAKTYQWKLASP
jgi:uncharacterized protein with NRDE domain